MADPRAPRRPEPVSLGIAWFASAIVIAEAVAVVVSCDNRVVEPRSIPRTSAGMKANSLRQGRRRQLSDPNEAQRRHWPISLRSGPDSQCIGAERSQHLAERAGAGAHQKRVQQRGRALGSADVLLLFDVLKRRLGVWR